MKLLAVGLLALAPVLGAASAMADTAAPPRLTVTGEGKVSAQPDMATISLGVVAENAEASEAVREMSDKMAAVMARLKEAGIDSRDVQTSGLAVNPRWRDHTSNPGEGPEITGFIASSQLSVRVRDLDALGGILDAVVADGANDFGGLSFGLQEPEPVQDAARRAAVEDAARKAALYAEAAGVALGTILSIDEGGGARPVAMRAEMAAFAADGGMPIAAGELDITSMVTITYSLEEAQ